MLRVRPAEVHRFRALVTKRLGFDLDESKDVLLSQVLAGRASAKRLSIDAYLSSLDDGSGEPGADGSETGPSGEVALLAETLTIGESYFFRHAAQFRALAEVVLPELEAKDAAAPLRLLSAGCAGGEEAYSLAMLCAEQLGAPRPEGRSFHVTGVDVNPAALRRARAGRYSSWSMREIAPAVQRRWFARAAETFDVAPVLRPSVSFAQGNLLEEGASLGADAPYHVIFCRNVLIYLTGSAARAVVARLTRALVPGGFLFLGHAESLRGLSEDFQLREVGSVFFYQRKSSAIAEAAPPPAQRSWMETVETAHERIRQLHERVEEPAVRAPVCPDLGPVREHLRAERYREGLETLAALASPASTAPEVLLLRAVLQLLEGSAAEAEPHCHALLVRDHGDAGAHHLLSLCREAVGDTSAARDHARMAAHLDPSFALARLHLGLLARRAGDVHEAERELAEASHLLPREDPERLLLFGGGFGRSALLALCRAPAPPPRPARGGRS